MLARKWLLQVGFDPNGENMPIHDLCHGDDSGTNLETLRLLLSHDCGVDGLDRNRNTPLHVASMNLLCDTAKIHLLLKNGANVNALNADGKSPIMLASMKGNAKVVRILAEHGANLHIADVRGWTALHYACNVGALELEAVRILLESGSDDSVKCNNGLTPFHYACEVGYLPIMYLFLRERVTWTQLQ